MPKHPEVRASDRRRKHQEYTRALRNRKKVRAFRREVNAAMAEAKRMQRSKKAGTRNFDDNMAKLGFQRIDTEDEPGNTPETKYARIG